MTRTAVRLPAEEIARAFAQVEGLQEFLAGMGEKEVTITPYNLYALLEIVADELRRSLAGLEQAGP